MSDGPIAALLVLLTIGLPMVFLANRVRIGALTAYLITGALAGFLARQYGHDWRILSSISRQNMEPMAEVGASLLLFSLGLELDLPGMRRQLRQVLVSTGVQIGLTVAAGTLAALAAGIHFRHAFALGCCLTMSSTLLVLRALEERRLRHRREGKMVVGLLLAQDLCLAPLMAVLAMLLPVHSGGHHDWLPMVAFVICLAMTVYARQVLATPLLAKVRALALPELEVAFAVIVALGAAWLTEQCQLGAAVGAFCAGLALGGDEHRHAVETSTRPLQALMAIVFFASMGVLLEFGYVRDHLVLVASALIVTLAVKAGLAALALWLSGLPGRSAVGGGIMTAQLGEFSFVLAATAFGRSHDPALADIYQLVVTVTCLSLITTPLLVRWAERFLPRSPLADLPKIGTTIVVAGLGPVGNTVVETLREQGASLLLVDRNRTLLARWQGAPGVRTHLGRIEDMDDWLPVLGHRPSLVVLTFPIADTSALVTSRLRQIDPGLVIIARSPYSSQVEVLHQAGAQFVICDERETTRALVPMLRKAMNLVHLEAQDAIPTTRIERRSKSVTATAGSSSATSTSPIQRG